MTFDLIIALLKISKENKNSSKDLHIYKMFSAMSFKMTKIGKYNLNQQ